MIPNRKLKLAKNQKGQVSIFLSMVMVIVFSLIAFVTNVGLYVKAKINLQNAVDSAAWSGAAAQARQLTNIAYMNWEMRNNFKEWMFKYYVLGQISNTKTHTGLGSQTDYRTRPFDVAGASMPQCIGANSTCFDHWNIPTTCVHFGNSHNICDVYKVPGLPRFEVAGLPNVSEQFEAAVDAFVTQKSANCIKRSDYNFATATSHAYSTGIVTGNSLPVSSADKVGAWLSSIELAMRMRNLEMIVNRPPIENGICAGGVSCAVNINELRSSDQPVGFSINERPIKAFLAGYKSLSGGSEDLSNTFILEELAPESITVSPDKLSGLLIPSGASYNLPGGTSSSFLQKSYLDLVPMIFNYVTFFNTFSVGTQLASEAGIDSSIDSQGACTSSETALPVPSYILGFFKNPQFVTYYAVKGKAKYIGLLNPFSDQNGIEMSAYAAAKPYGGRIGPILTKPTGDTIHEAQTNEVRLSGTGGSRSANYINSINAQADFRYLNYANPTPGNPVDGLPIPPDRSFYVDESSSIIGGNPIGGSNPTYGMPNLLYIRPNTDLGNARLPESSYYATNLTYPTDTPGLFNQRQFNAFKANLPASAMGQTTLTQVQINEAIKNVRAPTDYDATNYMVPTISDSNNPDLETTPALKIIRGTTDMVGFFGPLFGTGTIYGSNIASITTIMRDYIDASKASIDTYLHALTKYADAIRRTENTGASLYADAANGISQASLAGSIEATATNVVTMVGFDAITDACKKASIATKFKHFFYETTTECGVVPLKSRVREHISRLQADDSRRLFHITTYKQTALHNNEISTAFMPGPYQGVNESGEFSNPINNSSNGYLAKRSFYSTKLISLSAITGSDGYQSKVYVELTPPSSLQTPTDIEESFQNPLKPNIQMAIEEEFGTLEF